MITAISLRDLVEILAAQRDLHNQAILRYDQAFASWCMEIGEKLVQDREVIQARLKDVEAQVRQEAVSLFHATGDKHPCTGIEIHMNVVVGYGPVAALAWAREHRMALIPESLDGRAYSDLVTLGHAPGTIQEEPTATIAPDLVKALKHEAASRHLPGPPLAH